MSTRAYLKFTDEAAWIAARDEHLAGRGVEIDVIGQARHTTGESQVVDGMSVPVTVPVPGWLVNVTLAGAFPVPLRAFCVNPAQPRRVWFGSYTLAMPEVLEDAQETAMVPRGIGAAAPLDVIARIELAVLRGRITPELAAERAARINANIAVVEQRAVRDAAIVRRQAAVDAVGAANATRAATLAQRDAQAAIRADAIARLLVLVGADRIPVVAQRNAAAAEVIRLNALIDELAVARPALVAARDAATLAVVTANELLLVRRAARDALITT